MQMVEASAARESDNVAVAIWASELGGSSVTCPTAPVRSMVAGVGP